MAIYTAVSEDYDVEVFTSLKDLVCTLYERGVKRFDCHEGFQPDERIVAGNIRKKGVVFAYERDSKEWEYKIQVH